MDSISLGLTGESTGGLTLGLTIGLTLAAGTAWAESETTVDPPASVVQPLVIETFTPPKKAKTPAPVYPRNAQIKGHEGWVSMSMMVDAEGKPYDVTVINSSGDAAFEKAARLAASRWTFEPAELSSTKIDAAVRRGITFQLSGATGASRSYIRRFRKLTKAIESDDPDKAKQLLAALGKYSRTLYEQAYRQLGLYQYESKWGSPEGQYEALIGAAFIDHGRGFLPDALLTKLLVAKLNLELQTSYFASARSTATSLMERTLDNPMRQEIEKVSREIDQIEKADSMIVVSGRIDSTNYFSHSLLRPTFSFRNLEGDIAELRLHCDKGYVGFIFKPELSYTVEPGYRDCGLTAIGTPGSTFELVELATGNEQKN